METVSPKNAKRILSVQLTAFRGVYMQIYVYLRRVRSFYVIAAMIPLCILGCDSKAQQDHFQQMRNLESHNEQETDNKHAPTTVKETTPAKNSMFIIPLNQKSLVCKIENNKIRELGSFAKAIGSKSIIVNDEFICSIDSLISVFDIQGNLLKEIQPDFKLTSLNSKNKVVYFGGTNSGEIFAIIDLDDKDFKLVHNKLPIDVVYGKAIDDILIMKNKLILVDDIIYPKYLFEYDIIDSKNPKYIETKELDNNGTYEHILKGDLNENWLILLSSTVGMGGASDHIVIEGKTKGRISVHRDFYDDIKTEEQDLEGFRDICLIDNILYVLVNSIVYSLDLHKNISKEDMKKVDTQLSSIRKIIHAPNNEIIFIDYDNKYEQMH